MRMILTAVILLAVPAASGQKTPRDDQNGYYAKVARFRQEAKAAFDREMAREKAGDCPNANTTLDMLNCLAKENAATTENYDAYAGAIVSLVGAMEAQGNDSDPRTHAELVNDFNATETAWKKYRDAQCRPTGEQFKGGTLAGPAAGFCELMLVRNHMREIDKIYNIRLNN